MKDIEEIDALRERVAHLTQENEYLSRIFEATQDLVFDIDLPQDRLFWPRSAWRTLGIEPDEDGWIPLQRFWDLIHPADLDALRSAFTASVQHGKALNHQYRVRADDGQYRMYRSRGRAFYDHNTEPTRFLGSTSDLTHIMRTRSELASKTEEAEKLQRSLNQQFEINALQRTFVSMVSHEFRSPLTIIQGIARQILRRGDRITREKIDRHMTSVDAAVSRLVDLIEAVLSTAQLDSGKIQCRPEEVALAASIDDLSESMRVSYPEHEIHVDLDDAPETVICDPVLIHPVISNLLTNALKYSPGGTRIDIGLRGTPEGGAAIFVADQGPGIPEEELKMLFERFFRASTSGTIPGTGIGLNLVKGFVELHQGQVDVESEVGRGTRFTVTLPPLEAGKPVLDAAAGTHDAPPARPV